MQFCANLNFNGNCRAAFEAYERCFGGTLTMMTWGESPMADQVAKEWHERIIHAELTVGPHTVMGGDSPPGRHQPAAGFSVTVTVPTPAEAERVFAELSSGGAVNMPLGETFWASRFGVCVDRFGVPWAVNCMRQA